MQYMLVGLSAWTKSVAVIEWGNGKSRLIVVPIKQPGLVYYDPGTWNATSMELPFTGPISVASGLCDNIYIFGNMPNHATHVGIEIFVGGLDEIKAAPRVVASGFLRPTGIPFAKDGQLTVARIRTGGNVTDVAELVVPCGLSSVDHLTYVLGSEGARG
jgi:hypothetical protein